MKVSKGLAVLTAVAAVASLSGCVAPSPTVDEHMGDAVRTLRAQQTIAPEGLGAGDIGSDGRIAKSAIDTYHQSYAQPTPDTNVFSSGVVSGGAGR